jgi:hypothetical protein
MYRVYGYSVDILIIIVITTVNHIYMLKQCDNIVIFGELLVEMLQHTLIVTDTVSHKHIDYGM